MHRQSIAPSCSIITRLPLLLLLLLLLQINVAVVATTTTSLTNSSTTALNSSLTITTTASSLSEDSSHSRSWNNNHQNDSKKSYFYGLSETATTTKENASITSTIMTASHNDSGMVLPDVWPLWWKVTHAIFCCGQILAASYALLFVFALLSSLCSSSRLINSSGSSNSSSPPNKQQRSRFSAYNLHLVFLVIPDALLNGVAAGSSFAMTLNDGKLVPWYSYLYVWVVMFYFTSNFTLNSVVAYEIHELVSKSFQGIRVKPPSATRSCIQIGCGYVFAALAATWCVVDAPWSIMTIVDPVRGITLFGSPEPNGVFSPTTCIMIFFGFILIPTTYVLYVRWSIWRYRLLIKTGRTRVLSLYFMRILIVFFGFYFPNIILAVLRSRFDSIHLWFMVKNLRIMLEVFQTIITIRIACQKDDVGQAVEQFYRHQREKLVYHFSTICCRCCFKNAVIIKGGGLSEEGTTAATTISSTATPAPGKWEENQGNSRRRFSLFRSNREFSAKELSDNNSISSSNDDDDIEKNDTGGGDDDQQIIQEANDDNNPKVMRPLPSFQ